jgi:hypothetical protein
LSVHADAVVGLISQELISQLSLGGAALGIFAICAAFVLFRGVARIVLGTLTLGTSAWIAYQVWQHAPGLSVQWTGRTVPWILHGLPLAAGIGSFLIIRKIFKSLGRMFSGSGSDAKSHSTLGIAFRLLMALIPAAVIWTAGAAYILYSGSVSEVRQFSNKRPVAKTADPDWSQQFKATLETALPQSWLKSLNPSADPSRVALAKWIAAQSKSPLQPVIDPKTGRPYPRAIIVDDPELQNLARDGNFATLLRHPLLTKALEDPNLKKLLENLKL